jgi:hypothetical protein
VLANLEVIECEVKSVLLYTETNKLLCLVIYVRGNRSSDVTMNPTVSGSLQNFYSVNVFGGNTNTHTWPSPTTFSPTHPITLANTVHC